jgi:hypothetical protein
VPRIGTQLAELKGSDTVGGDEFGDSVAISGTTIVVGTGKLSNGRAYVFAKTGTGWTQAAELKGSDTLDDDFGTSLAISGTTIVVGSPFAPHVGGTGRAYVFTKTATGWKQVDALKGSDQSTVNADMFGASVAISGKTIVVGAPGAYEDVGQVYVFTKAATGWKQVARLNHSDFSGFGYAVAISGTTIVVSGAGKNNLGQAVGLAYVFAKKATGWKQVAELKDPYTGADDGFGWSLAISGTTIVVGTQNTAQTDCGPHPLVGGGAYMFTKTAGVWKQVPHFNPLSGVCNLGGYFGIAVAVSGTTVVVGTQGLGAGVYIKKATGWKGVASLMGSDESPPNFFEFGASVAISGTTVVVGAPEAGKAYVFEA